MAYWFFSTWRSPLQVKVEAKRIWHCTEKRCSVHGIGFTQPLSHSAWDLNDHLIHAHVSVSVSAADSPSC